MRILLFTLIFAASATAFSQDYYASDFWTGEYPNGVELIDDVTLNGKLIPDLDVASTLICTLGEKAVYHPWAQKTEAAFVTVTEISSYKLLEDYSEFELFFPAGTVLQELSYLSEGYCNYSVEGSNETFGMTCLGAFSELPAYQVLHQGGDSVQWFQATCQEGYKAWFELEDFIARAGDAAQSAHILDYGTVLEY